MFDRRSFSRAIGGCERGKPDMAMRMLKGESISRSSSGTRSAESEGLSSEGKLRRCRLVTPCRIYASRLATEAQSCL